MKRIYLANRPVVRLIKEEDGTIALSIPREDVECAINGTLKYDDVETIRLIMAAQIRRRLDKFLGQPLTKNIKHEMHSEIQKYLTELEHKGSMLIP